jgi:uncharacterized protein YdeI (YjbR/CyaY-like superfamily)
MVKVTKATKKISGGVAHVVPADLRKALQGDSKAFAAWEDLTPLSRNEWICWTISVKKIETRQEHVERMIDELKEGKRRPCCWIGCVHRKDKKMSPSQKYILGKKSSS